MRYISIILIIILLAVVNTAAAVDLDSIRKENQWKGRDIRVRLHRRGYTQPPNYHKSRQLPLGGGVMSDYSHAPKATVKSFPAIRYIERR